MEQITGDAVYINNFLSKFGATPDLQPLFRIVRAELQHEMRFGRFNVFYGSVFLREEVGVHDVPKYDFLPPCWVLEQWVPPHLCQSDDLPEAKQKGSYECRYAFLDKKRNELPLNFRVIEILMHHFFQPKRSPEAIASSIRLEMEKLDADETKYFDDVLNDDSWIVSALSGRMGISMHMPTKKDLQ